MKITGRKFKLSKFAFEFNVEDGYTAIYHAISMEVVYVKKGVYEKIKQNVGSMVCDKIKSIKHVICMLIQKNIIILFEEDESCIVSDIAESLRTAKTTTLRLQLTDVCNLDCSYCQIEKNYKQNKLLHMSGDIALRGLKLLGKFSPKNVQKSIILTGGEPTLNYSIIEMLLNRTKGILDSYRFVLFTNGTKITKRMAKTFKKYDVLVLISLDGKSRQHDLLRKDPLGNGSFKNALDGFNTCKEYGCKVGISGVLGSHNIQELKTDILDFFVKINPESVGLNFQHYLLNSENSNILPMEQYTDAIINAYKEFRIHGIYLENIIRIVEPFVSRKINAKECAALGQGITILPNGMVGPCKTLLVAGIMGRPLDEVEKLENLKDNEEFLNWSHRSTYTLESCKGCVAISLCGSGCTYDSYVIHGNINGIDKRTCVFAKKILEFLIVDLFWIVRNKSDLDIIIPSENERHQIYSTIALDKTDLKRSAGHEIQDSKTELQKH